MCISVNKINLFARNELKAEQIRSVKIFPVHIDRRNLMVVIGRVIINSFVGVTAGGINGNLILFFAANRTALQNSAKLLLTYWNFTIRLVYTVPCLKFSYRAQSSLNVFCPPNFPRKNCQNRKESPIIGSYYLNNMGQ